jgi:hypothetical protein
LGVEIEIAQITVERPLQPARLNDPAMGIAERVSLDLSDDITLAGISALPETAEVGWPITLNAVWQASKTPDQDYLVEWALQDDQGKHLRVQQAGVIASFPTTRWMAGDVWKEIVVLLPPGHVSEGRYALTARLVAQDGSPIGEPHQVGSLNLRVPSRSFDLPAPLFPANAFWQNGITLLGYDLALRDQTVILTLYWQPQESISGNLTVFVHLINSGGVILAQLDRFPVEGARPTAGWLPGEILADQYLLPVIPEALPDLDQIRLGLYDAETGLRVPLQSGEDFLLLPATFRGH